MQIKVKIISNEDPIEVYEFGSFQELVIFAMEKDNQTTPTTVHNLEAPQKRGIIDKILRRHG